MLDDNLPTFFLKSSATAKHHRELYLSYHGSDPAPSYSLHHIDPDSASPHHHPNCYAAALFDSHSPDILYGEDDIRRNGGVPPPPQPNLPTQFVIQLYAPDQQVRVERKEGKWGSSDSYEFSMPLTSFRVPSASTLDRGRSDPASLDITPKAHFVWKRESKLHKDLTCYYTGKSTDDVKKKSRRDPDIIISLWRSLREMTIYEPNLSRVDLEDPRGLEMVLLLSAVVLKDVYFGGNIRDVFNVSDTPGERKLSGGGRKLSNPQHTHSIHGAPNPLGTHPVRPLEPVRAATVAKPSSLPRLQTTPPNAHAPARPRPRPAAPPMPDPRTQWELDAETARLKAIAEAEAREERRRRAAMEKADELAARRLQKEAEEEARRAARQNAEIDRETERLRKLYGVQPIHHRSPTHANSSHSRHPYLQPLHEQTRVNLHIPLQPPPRVGSNGLYIQPAASSSALLMSGANPHASSLNVSSGPPRPGKKKSFFGLRSTSDDATERQRLAKKSSAMW
ncbi:hypothetical protein Tdes44962_MAKER02768 [Teratosphaeria destructans]|uniref:Uncharacterized protein n=1 Tax=Teratosphaeria destructans TaxID=418781 RepID=A0A9W7SSK4_9PEZI|nr:hypothetical protein Tdes44962_MAKER02768 [Teratosphaeria destructans]